MISMPVVITRPTVQTDAILKVTSTCICGSDLHLYLGFVPGMEPGEFLPHVMSSVPSTRGSLLPNDSAPLMR